MYQHPWEYILIFVQFNRWGEPNNIADIVGFLSSSDSRWITGELIDASGGSCL